MNIKINTIQFEQLICNPHKKYVYGSKLFGTSNLKSDIDYLVVFNDFEYEFNTLARYLPNVATFQYDDIENNCQYMFMTNEQFYRNLFTADCNIVADIVLFYDEFEDTALFLCRTQKIIKGYIGLINRDIKNIKGKNKAFHCFRGSYIASSLLDNKLPTITDIQEIKKQVDYLIQEYGHEYIRNQIENEIRILKQRLNILFDDNEISLYPRFDEENTLIQMLTNSNNLKEFKY